jgi:hypothetical protein
MKKIIAISVVATGMLFAGDVNLGVVQANTVLGAASATNGSVIKQGDIGVYGNSNVDSVLGLPAVVASVNSMGILVTADDASSIEQGTLDISDSTVHMIKSEVNTIAGSATAQGGSSITQGKWKITDVNNVKIAGIAQINTIAIDAIATGGAKIEQGSVSVGSVDSATIVVAGLNTMIGVVTASGANTEIGQGNINICGNTHLENCGN